MLKGYLTAAVECTSQALRWKWGECRTCAPGMLVVGPEGDFTMAELDQLVREGAKLVSLGSHRLRVETAALALLSAAQLLLT